MPAAFLELGWPARLGLGSARFRYLGTDTHYAASMRMWVGIGIRLARVINYIGDMERFAEMLSAYGDRMMLRTGMTISEIAETFEVHVATIYRLRATPVSGYAGA